MEITMVDLIVFLILIGMLVGVAALSAYILAIEIYDAVMRKWYYWGKRRDEKYERVAREWFEKGNRILKTKKMVFIITFTGSGGLGVYCNGEKCYTWNLSWNKIGRILSKKRILFLYKKGGIKSTSKEEFINALIKSDSVFHNTNVNNIGTSRFVFSFDTADMDLLPDWVTAELVAKKLEES